MYKIGDRYNNKGPKTVLFKQSHSSFYVMTIYESNQTKYSRFHDYELNKNGKESFVIVNKKSIIYHKEKHQNGSVS